MEEHIYFMRKALEQAKIAESLDEVPIGCVVVKNDKVIAKGYNKRETEQQSILHAEICAIVEACKILGSWRLEDCILYVTLEPCPMCAGAILQSRIKKVVYGAKDPKGGCIESCMSMYQTPGFNHYPEIISGVLEKECSVILKEFFKRKRLKSKK